MPSTALDGHRMPSCNHESPHAPVLIDLARVAAAAGDDQGDNCRLPAVAVRLLGVCHRELQRRLPARHQPRQSANIYQRSPSAASAHSRMAQHGVGGAASLAAALRTPACWPCSHRRALRSGTTPSRCACWRACSTRPHAAPCSCSHGPRKSIPCMRVATAAERTPARANGTGAPFAVVRVLSG